MDSRFNKGDLGTAAAVGYKGRVPCGGQAARFFHFHAKEDPKVKDLNESI